MNLIRHTGGPGSFCASNNTTARPVEWSLRTTSDWLAVALRKAANDALRVATLDLEADHRVLSRHPDLQTEPGGEIEASTQLLHTGRVSALKDVEKNSKDELNAQDTLHFVALKRSDHGHAPPSTQHAQTHVEFRESQVTRKY